MRVEPHELSDEELKKVFGENGWKRLPDEVYRKLEYHPATREVVEHHVAVYAAKDENAEKRVVKAPRPAELRMLPVVQAAETTCEMNKDGRPANAKS